MPGHRKTSAPGYLPATIWRPAVWRSRKGLRLRVRLACCRSSLPCSLLTLAEADAQLAVMVAAAIVRRCVRSASCETPEWGYAWRRSVYRFSA